MTQRSPAEMRPRLAEHRRVAGFDAPPHPTSAADATLAGSGPAAARPSLAAAAARRHLAPPCETPPTRGPAPTDHRGRVPTSHQTP
jgi:hypothetical protein